MQLTYLLINIQVSTSVSLFLLTFLFALSLVGGIITATVGPGGIPLIAALYLLTPLTPAEIAGTSGGIFFIGSIIGYTKFAQSGEVNYLLSGILSLASIIGVQIGVWSNQFVSGYIFEVILSGILVTVGLMLLYRQYNDLSSIYNLNPHSPSEVAIVFPLGVIIGIAGGLTGVGGPALSVPALLILGVPIIQAVSTGIVQSIFITASTATTYAFSGDTLLSLVMILAIPFAIGILIGRRIAHKLNEKYLKSFLGGFLIICSIIVLFI
jgi:hypothetical protein